MIIISIFLSAVTLAIAVIHILWGIGFWWPMWSEEVLVRAVVGFKGATRMPGPIPCGLVAVGLIFAANLPWFPYGNLRAIGLWACAAVFLSRGVFPYLPFWRRMTPQKPFATLDRTRYGPLCLLLGAGYVILATGALH